MPKGIKAPAEERFWAFVEKGDGCWTWKGFCHRAGHGRFMPSPGKPVTASRFSWELHNGPIPEGMCVCHRCDNPPCVNPDHLFLGTQIDNIHDMVAKGRHWAHSRSECYQGHALAKYWVILPSGKGVCTECQRVGRERRSLKKFGRLPLTPAAERTHCPKGHPYSGENLILLRRGGRQCRACGRAAAARLYQERRARRAS